MVLTCLTFVWFVLSYRGGQCPLWLPPQIPDSAVNGLVFDTELVAPFAQAFRLAVNLNEETGCLVPLLLCERYPLAIVWLVVTVCVDSVEREFVCVSIVFRPDEETRRVKPFIANLDSAPTVAVVIVHVLVVATVLHVAPYTVEPSAGHAM